MFCVRVTVRVTVRVRAIGHPLLLRLQVSEPLLGASVLPDLLLQRCDRLVGDLWSGQC